MGERILIQIRNRDNLKKKIKSEYTLNEDKPWGYQQGECSRKRKS